MSVIGATTAIISVGMGCQTAHQLKQNKELLGSLLGETFDHCGPPFDWLFTDPVSIARMLAADEYFPASLDELTTIDARPYWAKFNCFYWHEAEIFSAFDAVLRKFRLKARAVARLKTMQRRIFIFSNMQQNLYTFGAKTGKVSPRVTADQLLILKDAIDDTFGHSEFYIVTCAKGIEPSAELALLNVIMAPEDQTPWEGVPEVWRDALTTIIN